MNEFLRSENKNQIRINYLHKTFQEVKAIKFIRVLKGRCFLFFNNLVDRFYRKKTPYENYTLIII